MKDGSAEKCFIPLPNFPPVSHMDLDDNIFMLPGPVKMHPRVLRAMSLPARAHRDPTFFEIHREIRELLKYTFQTNYDVAVISGSGTAGMDAAISNLLTKKHTAVVAHNGKFGERLVEIVKRYSNAIAVGAEWGEVIDTEKVAEAVEENDVDAVVLCHNETSTGVTNPAWEIGKIAKKHGLLYILDGITSVGGIEVRPEKMGADVVVFGSQKCVAAPAGMAALAVSPRAEEMMVENPPYYLDLKKHLEKYNNPEKADTPYTCAIPLFQALLEALRMIKEEGIEERWRKCAAMGEATREAVKAMGLKLFPRDERYASNTLTAIWLPEGVTDKEFRGTLKEKYHVVVAGAQEHIKGKVFRIGHMGIVKWTDLAATIVAIEATMRELGLDVERGAGPGVIAEHMARYGL